jgi:hypothetical protein
MRTKYEANFGVWDLDSDPYEVEFFAWVIAASQPATCSCCVRSVDLLPAKMVCASCLQEQELKRGYHAYRNRNRYSC